MRIQREIQTFEQISTTNLGEKANPHFIGIISTDTTTLIILFTSIYITKFMVLMYKNEYKNSNRPEDGLCHNEERFGHQPIKTFDLNNQLGCPSISQILIGNKSGATDHSIELL